ncbi:MAG: preprotein translocase subunit YajC [Clostridia bacterium]|nr:preprotein translocase subunit YajC [Clostridia bacterium]
MFNFLLEGNASGGWIYIVMIVIIIAMFFFMSRSQKKRDREAQQMRDSLAVGDEVTTIGGIIGKVVSIKEETFVLETTKDKTKIRFLKGAIRSIDVKMADVAASVLETKAAEAAAQETPAEVEAPAESTEENK